jgi:hypothetical protein
MSAPASTEESVICQVDFFGETEIGESPETNGNDNNIDTNDYNNLEEIEIIEENDDVNIDVEYGKDKADDSIIVDFVAHTPCKHYRVSITR